ncbi:MAG TPA: sigma-70 family RNA polymerase sigma factor [Treponemataceae bacterium]|nr:sigma-70 family RNA polymerase sigma factor [Treponemataceae bacterium]
MYSDINYIIQESLKGDKIYIEKLLKRLNPLIYKNIYKYYAPSDPIVEDLLQEGYVVILKSLKNYDIGRNVHFLQYVKTNLCYYYINYYKKDIRQRTLSLEYLNETGKTLISTRVDQAALIIREEEKNELHKCIKNLTPKEKKIINLFYFQGSSIREISEELDLKYRSVINMKCNAIKKLRKMIKLMFK